MTSQLVGSDYTEGALLPHYVNGRLLVAEDLATGQQSLRTRDTRIGEAAGAGVVRGLWVTGSATTLTVQPGLALSPAGEPVVVPRSVTLQLTFAAAGQTPDDASFGCCGAGPDSEDQSSLTSGVLLLTARAACRLEGQAPLVPPPGSPVSPACAAQWMVQGVEFRAVRLPVGKVVGGEKLTEGNRRNLVAHWCFGTEQLAHFGADPFGFDPDYSGFAQLDAADLTPYDVPLAVFSWNGSQLDDLDNWSARRRVTDPDPTPSPWSATVKDARVADGQARFLQFQDQAEELVSRALAGSATAPDHFGYLPPVGFLPVDNRRFRELAEETVHHLADLVEEPGPTAEETEAAMTAEWKARAFNLVAPPESPMEAPFRLTSGHIGFYKNLIAIAEASIGYGFDPVRFFGGLARPGGLLDWELAEWALHQSWRALPVATSGAVAGSGDVDGPGEVIEDVNIGRLAARAQLPRTPPITYYYVIANLEAADARTSLFRLAGSKARKHIGFVRSHLYVVFIANRRWASGADAPFVPYSLRGLFDVR